MARVLGAARCMQPPEERARRYAERRAAIVADPPKLASWPGFAALQDLRSVQETCTDLAAADETREALRAAALDLLSSFLAQHGEKPPSEVDWKEMEARWDRVVSLHGSPVPSIEPVLGMVRRAVRAVDGQTRAAPPTPDTWVLLETLARFEKQVAGEPKESLPVLRRNIGAFPRTCAGVPTLDEWTLLSHLFEVEDDLTGDATASREAARSLARLVTADVMARSKAAKSAKEVLGIVRRWPSYAASSRVEETIVAEYAAGKRLVTEEWLIRAEKGSMSPADTTLTLKEVYDLSERWPDLRERACRKASAIASRMVEAALRDESSGSLESLAFLQEKGGDVDGQIRTLLALAEITTINSSGPEHFGVPYYETALALARGAPLPEGPPYSAEVRQRIVRAYQFKRSPAYGHSDSSEKDAERARKAEEARAAREASAADSAARDAVWRKAVASPDTWWAYIDAPVAVTLKPGFSLTEDLVRRPARCVEVLVPDGASEDVAIAAIAGAIDARGGLGVLGAIDAFPWGEGPRTQEAFMAGASPPCDGILRIDLDEALRALGWNREHAP